ncbi:MAG: TIGR00282 family metallophosphoesterase [Erysipelotrichaceae bacterium]|nr:TIGR00282 family metallophosphoesterase [Erysipelotrichaceae bacterium]MDY5252477.1 TIGR00282 family metallophosphoesterase [Erysipelotrichaceae bacterium]
MKILFIGDIVGEVGRNMLSQHLASLKHDHAIDLTIVNGENAAHGKGITPKIAQQFKELGVDVITLGNHAFSKNVIKEKIDELDYMVRPCNMEPLGYGQGFTKLEVLGLKVMIINVCGAAFMDNIVCSPFVATDKILANNHADITFVDFHGEATAEKRCYFEYYKDQIQCVVGTHTHVQTADEMISEGSCFISDVGMCGAIESILGRDIEEVIARSVHQQKTYFTPAKGKGMLCGVVIEVDNQTKKVVKIERLQVK